VTTFFFFQAEDGIRDWSVTGVQTCALPISPGRTRGDRALRRVSRLRRSRPHYRLDADGEWWPGHDLTRGRRVEKTRAPVDSCHRSEEHTSELQSLTNLACRLLL